MFGDPSPRVCNFLMLNPSTADESDNDPTVERCERRARSWGFDGLIVTNIFAWRSTDPSVLPGLPDPVGPENDRVILQTARMSDQVICAWGKDGAIRGRSAAVRSLLRDVQLYALRVSEKTGECFHPLYLPYSAAPFPWNEE